MSKKRIQVMLPESTFKIVEEISQLGGVSMGSLLGELVSENESGLVMIRDALKAAKNQDLSGAIDKLQAGLLDSIGQGAELTKEMNELRKKTKS